MTGFSMAAILFISIISTVFTTITNLDIPQADFTFDFSSLSGWLFLFYVCLIGPIFEEVLFRGAILRTLNRYNRYFAIIASALIFGLFHLYLEQGAHAFVLGLVLAYASLKTDSLMVPILLHIFHNRCNSTQSRRATLIEHNLRLVVYIARRFENTGINLEDLISIGTIGLVKAVGTFNTDKNIKLATYASRCIENEILMYLRKNANQRGEVSFDEPLNTDWDGNELLLSDILGTDSDLVIRPMEDDVDRQLLAMALEKLGDRERSIITMRFGLGGRRVCTQKEVADRMGISQSYISRLEKRIIARLRKEIVRMS